ncbi:glutamyl-Q tRNA(Asp) ligase [Sulfurifustis variabilis]|uniref:Glutamyl-Q tRNA(Asp) synthetase n=2 Tax=Sulfurifustis variabilis TaxID=1675686 RepID=A0A1B4V940_9GAMM|nr:glutamyl-Q tRNA(Asp) ligase [Sulfurifustis variabilis]
MYRGRFAPSPTGPLHFGSLVAAVGSFLEARARRGEWLVRIEDLDPPREPAGAAGDILRTLDAFGLHWDGEVVYQSRRQGAYEAALAELRRLGVLYACGCTRREIADSAVAGVDGPVYPGTCRNGVPAGREGRTLRVRTDDAAIAFEDRMQGRVESRLERDVGDFVLRRADGFYAYQLAVVVDDAAQGVNDVVRGADLLGSTARQIHLQRLLGLPTPAYAHLPIAVDAEGAKLSKQTGAEPVRIEHASELWWDALWFLGQEPPADLRTAPVAVIRDWAIAHWHAAAVPRTAAMRFP